LSQTLAIAAAQSGQSWDQITGPLSIGGVKVELIDPLNVPEWDREVLSHPEANIFHLSAWAKVLSASYGHKPLYLRFSREGRLAALLPIMEVKSFFTGVRGVSLPFSDFCSPLIFDQAIGIFPVLEEVIRLGVTRHWKYFETRSNALTADFSPAGERFYGHELDLTPGRSSLLAGLAPSVRRAIRKAENSNIQVEVTQTLESMFEFYRLHLETRRRHGVPPQPLAFFGHIHREIIGPGNGFIVHARLNQTPVASAVFFHAGTEALYKYGASNRQCQCYRANNLVMWKAIEHLCQLGFRRLLFGRTELANDGLRRFKRNWGEREYELKYFRFERAIRPVTGGSARARSGLYTHIFRNLPIVLNQAIGKLAYPHLD
jgi:hypothetical protein